MNIEQKIIASLAPDYDKLPPLHKLEVFQRSMSQTDGQVCDDFGFRVGFGLGSCLGPCFDVCSFLVDYFGVFFFFFPHCLGSCLDSCFCSRGSCLFWMVFR